MQKGYACDRSEPNRQGNERSPVLRVGERVNVLACARNTIKHFHLLFSTLQIMKSTAFPISPANVSEISLCPCNRLLVDELDDNKCHTAFLVNSSQVSCEISTLIEKAFLTIELEGWQ